MKLGSLQIKYWLRCVNLNYFIPFVKWSYISLRGPNNMAFNDFGYWQLGSENYATLHLPASISKAGGNLFEKIFSCLFWLFHRFQGRYALLNEYGELRSFLTDRFPECRQRIPSWSKNAKKNPPPLLSEPKSDQWIRYWGNFTVFMITNAFS